MGDEFYENEIKRLKELVDSMDQTIANQHREIHDLKRDVRDVNASFDSIRESNERLRKERGALEGQVAGLKADNDYWVQQYQLQLAKQETSEAAYLKVVKVLAGRE
jgi:chromosome segregation ATPase